MRMIFLSRLFKIQVFQLVVMPYQDI